MQKKPSLLLCIVMDMIGYASYSIPLLAELADLVWAPISGIVFYRMFGSWKGALFNMTEELLPGLDFIPTFTIMWFMRLGSRHSQSVQTVR